MSPEEIEWEDILSSKYHGFYHSLFCTRPNGKRKPICNPNDMRIQNSCNVRLCLVCVKYFPENKYFPEMLFSGKENIFKCLVVF